MATRRFPIWLVLIVGALGLPLAALLGLWGYKSATTPILHPDAQQIRSVTHSDPSRKWLDAVERGRQVIRAALVEQNLPGLSVAVGSDGDVVWAEGFGWADLGTQLPVAPDIKFKVADASKALTSAAVGRLLEKNTLRLDDEIQVYVPEFPKKPWPVTLRQLMAQVGGVTTDHGGEAPLSNTRPGDGNPAPPCERTVDGLQLDDFADRELLFEPGTKYSPSSYGWVLVSAAIEAATKEPFYAFMRRQVFEPLGMHDTTVDVTTEAIPARATFYFLKFGLARDTRYGPKPARVGDYSCYAGAAAFLSTPSDLVRFGMGIDGPSPELRRPWQRVATARHRPTAPDAAAAGLGRRDRLRPWLGARDASAGGPTHADGGPWQQRGVPRWRDVPHDVSRTRARRRRDGQHFVRGHEVDCAEHRAGLRRTRAKSGAPVIASCQICCPKLRAEVEVFGQADAIGNEHLDEAPDPAARFGQIVVVEIDVQ